MKFLSRSTLPWLLTVLFAVAFVVLAFSRKESSKAGTTAAAAPASPPSSRPTPPAKKILYWVDPMVAGYKSDKPGKSPFMDMDLVPVYEDGSTGETKEHAVSGYVGVNVSTDRQQAIGVRLGKAEVRDLTKTIRTVGRVTFDETLNHQIHAKFEGFVERLYVDFTGKPVRKGQPLLS
ncbi:MAG TPA: efflux RND transporter periplasmic adaptor subunit, partial [Thermoanaerobaculia bacterium]|nr:efflux RND transporter periplasmic adaptor subunit [Thermoanaerobaculia bacterium]